MKKKRMLIGLGAILALSISMMSCTKLLNALKETCPDDKPYYCSSTSTCCPANFTWYGGNGYCYQSKSDCQSHGSSCTKCY